MAYRRRVARRATRRPRTTRRTYRRRVAPRRRTVRRTVGRRRYPRRGYGRHRLPGRRTTTHTKAVRASTMRNGDIVIEHMEYMGDLIPSTNGSFLAQTYQINPGLAAVFPFVSGIGCQYELYDPTHMSIILKSTSGNAFSSVNASTGSMGITTLYNVYTPTSLINNKVIAEGYEYSTSGNPSKSQISRINCKHNRNPQDTYFVRTGPVPTGQTLNMTDICNVVVWSSGLQTTTASAIAEIWVKYRIVFRSPRPFSGQLGLNILTAQYTYSSNVSATAPLTGNYWGGAGTTIPSAAGVSNGLLANTNNGLTLLFSSTGSSSTITFPAGIISGNYLVSLRFTGTSAGGGGASSNVAVSFPGTLAKACGIYSGAANSALVLPTSNYTSSTDFSLSQAITITGPSAQFTFSNGGTFPTSITAMTLVVAQFNGGITTPT